MMLTSYFRLNGIKSCRMGAWLSGIGKRRLAVGLCALALSCGLGLQLETLLAQSPTGTPSLTGIQSPTDHRSPMSLVLAEQKALQQAVTHVAPCVVQIETFGGLDRIDDKAIASGPTTGTIVDADGWIVTSLHGLLQQPASILVNLPDGTRAPAQIVARDYSREIALLKIDALSPLPVAQPSDPKSWQVGQWSIALGKTYDARSVTQSYGIISALGRAYGRAVQTDAKVSPINYGGPLVDLFGNVIGILTPIAAGEMLGDDGTVLYDSGIGFAVPLSDILQRLPTMKSGNDIRAGKLGVVTADSNEMAGPVRLTGAAPGSPAAKVGMKAGDVILEANGRPVNLLADLRHVLASIDAGQSMEIVIRRDQQTLTMSCDLVAEIPVYRRRFLGMQVEDSDGGLKIRALIGDSPAALSGLEVGQTVTHCNDQELVQRENLESLLAVADLDVPLRLTVQSEDGQSKREISVVPTKWPDKLIGHDPPVRTPPGNGAVEATNVVQITELKLADIPNKIHAILPAAAKLRPIGCLLVFSEPGELSADKLKTNWERLAIDYGWLIVFPVSNNPQAWTRDEVELASRLLARLDQEYTIDRCRTVIGGMGVGGQLALIAALVEKERIAGTFTLGTSLRRLPLRTANAPMQSLDFLFIGDRQLESVAEQLGKLGYVANSIAAEIDTSKWDTVPFEALKRWLESLAYL